MSRVGLPGSKPDRHKKTEASRQHRDNYSEWQIHAAGDLYQTQIETFGYEF